MGCLLTCNSAEVRCQRAESPLPCLWTYSDMDFIPAEAAPHFQHSFQSLYWEICGLHWMVPAVALS